MDPAALGRSGGATLHGSSRLTMQSIYYANIHYINKDVKKPSAPGLTAAQAAW
jgi:hypothetical protein